MNECIQFFNKFSVALTHQNRELCQELLSYEAESKILAQFIHTLNKDSEAILNAATYCYNNGLAEGTVNKIKIIKRIMFGRASFNLLRIKVLSFT